MDDDRILYLTRKEVAQICEDIDVVSSVADAFRAHARGETTLPDESYLRWKDRNGNYSRSLNMPGRIAGAQDVVGTKIINANPENPARGIPRASGITILFDSTTARVSCLMEAGYISATRTACVTVLAATTLGSSTISKVAIIGAGELGNAHVDLLSRRLNGIKEIQVFDLSGKRASKLVRSHRERLHLKGIEIKRAESVEGAIRSADLVVPVTTTTEGYIPFEWIKAGALIVNISLDDVMPDLVLSVDEIVVDDWNLVIADRFRLLGRMHREGLVRGPMDREADVSEHKTVTEFGDILEGTAKWRRRRDTRVLFNPFGMAIEDIGVAGKVFESAKSRAIGTWLDR